MGKFKSTMEEFKAFIFRGNVVDMAVGVVVGGAFSKIVNSLVNDIMMPALGAIIGSTSFTNYKIVIHPAVKDAAGEIVTPEAAILYGSFIQEIVNFLIIAACVFCAIKVVSGITEQFKKKEKEEAAAAEEPAAPAGPTTEELLAEIRDLLKEQKA